MEGANKKTTDWPDAGRESRRMQPVRLYNQGLQLYPPVLMATICRKRWPCTYVPSLARPTYQVAPNEQKAVTRPSCISAVPGLDYFICHPRLFHYNTRRITSGLFVDDAGPPVWQFFLPLPLSLPPTYSPMSTATTETCIY